MGLASVRIPDSFPNELDTKLNRFEVSFAYGVHLATWCFVQSLMYPHTSPLKMKYFDIIPKSDSSK